MNPSFYWVFLSNLILSHNVSRKVNRLEVSSLWIRLSSIQLKTGFAHSERSIWERCFSHLYSSQYLHSKWLHWQVKQIKSLLVFKWAPPTALGWRQWTPSSRRSRETDPEPRSKPDPDPKASFGHASNDDDALFPPPILAMSLSPLNFLSVFWPCADDDLIGDRSFGFGGRYNDLLCRLTTHCNNNLTKTDRSENQNRQLKWDSLGLIYSCEVSVHESGLIIALELFMDFIAVNVVGLCGCGYIIQTICRPNHSFKIVAS